MSHLTDRSVLANKQRKLSVTFEKCAEFGTVRISQSLQRHGYRKTNPGKSKYSCY